MPEQPGDGGIGFSWFAIEVVSVPVYEGQEVEFVFECEVDLTGLIPVEPPFEIQVGAGTHFTSGPIDIRKEVEFVFPALVEVPSSDHLVEFAFSGETVLVRPVEFSILASTSAIRPVRFDFEAEREPAYLWVQALREDEEFMEILLSG